MKEGYKKIPLYTIVYKETAGGFSGYLKEKPNIISQGKTKEELIECLKDALKLMTVFKDKFHI